MAELDGFAWKWAQSNARRALEVEKLDAACLLVRHDILDGDASETLADIGCIAVQKGLRSCVAGDVVVHRTGAAESGSRVAAPETGSGVRPGESTVPSGAAFPQDPNDVASPERPLISLCMIVRDSARTLEACLASIRPWVDELVIVDTGSIDDTPEIARRFGARVSFFPWCDDFSAARNESLRHARGKWLLWMDSDDTISPDNGRFLRQLVEQAHDDSVLAFILQVHCPGPDNHGHRDVTVVDHVKLLRNVPGMRFEGRIHEQVLPAIRRLGGRIGWTDVFVEHSGSDHSREGQAKKLARDLRILLLEQAERPDHPFTLFNLGMTYSELKRYPDAVVALRDSIRLSGPNESHLRKAYALLIHSLVESGAVTEATQACAEALARFPEDPELQFRRGMLAFDANDFDTAIASYQAVLRKPEERFFASIDQGIVGYKARHNLALVYAELQQWDEAEREWREVLRSRPSFRIGWRCLADSLIRQEKWDDLQVVIEQLAQGPVRAEAFLLDAKAALARGDSDRAREMFRRAMSDETADEQPLRSLCQLDFEQGPLPEAERSLRQLVARCPDEASAHHNLATVLLRQGRRQEAVECYQTALRLRPNWAPTHLQLGYAWRELGRHDEAAAAWRAVLDLAPDDPHAQEGLARLGGC